MLHRHHKIPKHMGGSDDESNIELLTRKEHAEAHRKLYEQFGKREDYWAWKFLSNSEDWEGWTANNPMKDPAVRAKVSQSMKEYYRTHSESKETREKKRRAKLGSKNPAFGKHGFFKSAHRKEKCDHCDVVTTLGNLNRWHNENCKQKST